MTTETDRVAVLGAGVVGVATAYFLAKNGFRVTLVERQAQAGLETSFANGGLVTPSMSDPWAAPGTPGLLLRWLGRENSPFLLRPRAIPGLASWGLAFLRQCNRRAWLRNTGAIYRLCSYSHEALRAVADDTGIDYEANRSGTLHLFRDRSSMESTRHVAGTLAGMGVAYRALDVDGCVALEPTLDAHRTRISGGIHFPEDEAGDARMFTQKLAGHCAAGGVEIRYGETVEGIETSGQRLAAVVTDAGRIEVEACVVALGNASAALLRPLGIELPIYPVKGYSITFPAARWNGAPVVPFVDDARKIGIVRIGDRVRIAGTAEFTGHDRSLNPKRVANLRGLFFETFPDYPDKSAGEAWTGLRPMTPDGIPYLGPTPIRGLFLNTGHGHLGWTMSCGSAKAVTDLIMGRPPEIDVAGMTLAGR